MRQMEMEGEKGGEEQGDLSAEMAPCVRSMYLPIPRYCT